MLLLVIKFSATNLPNTGNRPISEYLLIIGYIGSFLLEPLLTEEMELELMLTPSNKALWFVFLPYTLTKVLEKHY